MKATRFYTLLALLFIIATTTTVEAQETLTGKSSVELKFTRYIDEDTTKIFSLYDYCCHVAQRVTIEKHLGDSVKLDLEVCNFHPALLPFFYNNMEVYGVDNGNKEPLQFDLSNVGVAIDNQGYDTIDISFYFNPNSLMLYKYKMAFGGITMYQSGWHSMFFTSSNMEFDEINVICADGINMFLEGPYVHKDNRFTMHNLNNPTINAFLINLEYYVNDTLSENPDITAFLFKGNNAWQDTITGDWHDWEPDEESHPKSRLPSNVASVIDNLSSFFNKRVASLEYIDTYTTLVDNDDESCWGAAYDIDDENWFIVMDTSFWNDYQWCHETVHCFNTKLPCRNDSSYYFFNESMTEFVSVYFGTPEKTSIDSVFIKRMEKYGKLLDGFPSIFQVENNLMGIDGSGSFYVTYVKTPYCLHLLAKDVGEHRFMEICQGFYKHINKMETYTFADFADYMLKHGVSHEQWEQFMTNLYSKDF